MNAVEPYRGRREVAVADPVSAIPDAARGIVEWATSAEAAYSLAQRLVSTSFSPQQYRGKPEDAAAAILSGAEVGLSPMASLRAFDIIQGTAAPRALTIRAIVQSRGHEMVVDEATPQRVRMRGRRRGATEWQSVEWTMARATQLGLAGKQQWKAQPQTMLIARCTTELGRLIAADALLGLPYSIEELADSEPEPTTPVARTAVEARPARVSRARAPRPAEPAPEPPLDEPAPQSDGQSDAQESPQDSAQDSGHPNPATAAQVQRLAIAMGKAGITERDARLDWLSARLDREVMSSKDLSKSEAASAIDALEQGEAEPPLDGDDPWQS